MPNADPLDPVALARELGADDAAIVPLSHPDLADERPHVLRALPSARSLLCLVFRTHADNIRSPARSVANLEFHRSGQHADEVAQKIAVALSARGHRTINPAMAFPMEMDDFPGRAFVVSHKRVAVAGGLGQMGVHRNVIHPRFGSFISLATVVTELETTTTPAPLDFNPCRTATCA